MDRREHVTPHHHCAQQAADEWRVKKAHERTLKVPALLIALINALPRKGPLVLSEHGVTPDYYLLKDLKRIAVTAGLDPAHCWLHKFRASGASRYFQAGMPLPDTMQLGGWRDVDSIKRYMGLLTEDRLEQAVEAA